MHVEFDISGSGIKYKTGDHLGVFAENGADITQRVAKALKIDVKKVFRLSEAKRGARVSRRTFRDTHHGCRRDRKIRRRTDTPQTSCRRAASVASGKDVEKLAFLASPAGKDEFAKYITATA